MTLRDWDETFSDNDCLRDASEYNAMVSYIKHSSSCTYTIYDDEDSSNQKFRFTYSGDDSIMEGAAGTYYDLIIKANTADVSPYLLLNGLQGIVAHVSGLYAFEVEDATGQVMVTYRTPGGWSELAGDDGTGDDFRIRANSQDTYPYISLLGNSSIGYYSHNDHYFYADAVNQLKISGNANDGVVYGPAATGSDLQLRANQTDTYPFIELNGDAEINLLAKTNVNLYTDGSRSFRFEKSGDDSYIYGGSAANDDLLIKCNSTDAYPIMVMDGNSGIRNHVAGGTPFELYDGASQMFKFLKSGTTAVMYGTHTTGDDLVIQANDVDSYPSIGLYAAIGKVRLGMGPGEGLYLDWSGTAQMIMTYGGNISHIYGGSVTGDDLHIHANQVDTYPFLKLYGDDYIGLDTKNAIVFRRTGTQSFKFTISGNDSRIHGMDTTGKNLVLAANLTDTYPYTILYGNSGIRNHVAGGTPFELYDGASQMFKFLKTGTIAVMYGTHTTGDDLVIQANDVDSYPSIGLYAAAGRIRLGMGAAEALYFDYGGTQGQVFSYTGGVSYMYGSPNTTEDMIIKANSTDTYPYIYMLGNQGIQIYLTAGTNLNLFHGATLSFKVGYAANLTTVYGGGSDGDDLSIKANSFNTYPFIRLLGNDGVYIENAATKGTYFKEGGTTMFQFYSSGGETIISTAGSGNDYFRLYSKRHLIVRSDTDGRESLRLVSEATQTTMSCGPISGDDLKIKANASDAYPYVRLEANDYALVALGATKSFRIADSDTSFIKMSKSDASTILFECTADLDLYLNVSGTGLLKYGTEVTNAGSDRGKLIAIKTAAGDTVYVKTYDTA